tara:strand:+ start:533 stop:739 length:207 start_codon:yes stop_codon:yes gene_type:complete
MAEHPKYLVINPMFEGIKLSISSKKMFNNNLDKRFFNKMTRIKNIVHELYAINKNLNKHKVKKLLSHH